MRLGRLRGDSEPCHGSTGYQVGFGSGSIFKSESKPQARPKISVRERPLGLKPKATLDLGACRQPSGLARGPEVGAGPVALCCWAWRRF